MKKIVIISFAALFLYGCSSLLTTEEDVPALETKINNLYEDFENRNFNFFIPGGSKVTAIKIDSIKKEIVVETNKQFSYRFFRESDISEIYNEVRQFLYPYYADFDLTIKSISFPIEELVPNFYRKYFDIDKSRIPLNYAAGKQVVKNLSTVYETTKGLNDRNIALWHSHGWYYNHDLDRWLWQRARLFQMVEDIGPISYVLPYLVPMLENAGANVYIPRERDVQVNEIIIDNDVIGSKSYLENGQWKTGKGNAFLLGSPPYEANYNPFEYGTHRIAETNHDSSASVEFIPEIPTTGNYAVYVSYVASDQNTDDARFIVYHTGGKTEFSVDQTMGGSTWHYLGTFKFAKGTNQNIGRVSAVNESNTPGKTISVDAVRFGGGMGVVKRGGKTSGRAKYIEGARYYLQFAGMPDTLIYNINNDSTDYADDYQSRGEWVNYLVGNPYGPNKDRTRGLGIPIDLSLAFHTDAGITHNDTTVGTLSIYSVTDDDSSYFFPDGVSRLANRDLADMLQTQLVNDLRYKYDPVWNRRQLFDGRYSEAVRPNVPSVLLELLSHQNFLDSKFQLDPRFRFDASRSIYKAFLKYIAYNNRFDPVVQPLPVTHMNSRINKDNSVTISWMPQTDSLESTAVPTGYIIYKSIGKYGFDNGLYVTDNSATIENLKVDQIYNFKVTAVNDGGESFPSEIVSVGLKKNSTTTALVINAFDRICGPASIETEKFTGFLDFFDMGVPDKYDISYTGRQHDFDPSHTWRTDDIPGHGASYANYENKIIAGNTFDFGYTHGESLMANGLSFVTVSDETVENKTVPLNDYKFIDLIFGEEKETGWIKSYTDSLVGKQFKTFNDSMKSRITDYLSGGGNIFVSGSYIGTDMFYGRKKDDPDIEFVMNVLKYKLSSNHAVVEGNVESANSVFLPEGFSFKFNTELNDSIYAAEAPDAITNTKDSEVLLRYSENLYGSAVGYKNEYGIVAFGFPFEIILGNNDRDLVMKSILEYLKIR
ncbi:MAG: fibronectin type III domain-containing protein [Melioribacteraceae bacterium]|nr:fibronectin type III domain-containing protein [Melioribacteraceae bacterium]